MQLEFFVEVALDKVLRLMTYNFMQKSEKSNGRFSRKSRTNGQTDGKGWFLRSPLMNWVTKNLQTEINYPKNIN